jgi:beta-glucosidase
VKNASDRDGAEVVQVYVKDMLSSVVVPNIQLKGFAKVMIEAGATKTVEVDLKVSDWGLWNIKMEYVVEPGNFTVFVGSSSADFRANTTVTVV